MQPNVKGMPGMTHFIIRKFRAKKSKVIGNVKSTIAVNKRRNK
jgi:hypothetical protein